MNLLLYAITGFLLTVIGTGYLLKWLKRKSIFDVPNERSSHQNPTPVGGGLIIVFVCLGLFLIYSLLSEKPVSKSYFAGAILVSVISWLDDLFSVPIIIRFIFHSLAAGLVVYAAGVSSSINLPLIGVINFGFFSNIIWFLWIVWLINAYNFMDGIDGIAGVQAVTAGLSWALTGYLISSFDIETFGLIIASSCAGFLLFNWQPAKIFMGDVGSAFLGFTFAVMPLLITGKVNSFAIDFLLVSVIFVWLFVFDSLRTLFVRLLAGEKIWQPHRRHIYQRLIIKGLSHQKVSLIYGLLSVIVSAGVILRYKTEFFKDFLFLILLGIISLGLVLYSHAGKNVELEK